MLTLLLIMVFENEQKALTVTEKMKEGGLHNVFRIADYGLHIYLIYVGQLIIF